MKFFATMSRTQVQLWDNRFKEDQEAVKDDDRLGRTRLSTTDVNM